MGKILRLSLNNIKKHKFEAVSLALLVMFCMMLLGSSLAAFPSANTIFKDMLAKTESWENFMMFSDKDYDPSYLSLLEEQERVDGTAHAELIYDYTTRYIDKDGKKQALYMGFITVEEEAKLEKSFRYDCLSDEETASLEHPIYLPFSAKHALELKAGDTFEVVCGTRVFPFTVAGFYETFFFSESALGYKMVVNQEDYNALAGVLDRYHMLAFNTKDHAKNSSQRAFDDYEKSFEEKLNRNYNDAVSMKLDYDSMEMVASLALKEILIMMIAMAVVITVCVAFMIWFRITTEIKSQLESIGVLEALGYTSRNIAFSYMLEYIIISAVGIAAGTLGCVFLTPVIFRIGEMMAGYKGNLHGYVLPVVISAVFLLIFVSVIAFIRSWAVRKYPPVMAFRRGIADHHFGRDHLPLRKTKGNAHFRLAMKETLHSIWQSIGLAACLTLAVATVITCFILFCGFGLNSGFTNKVVGIELSDISMQLTDTADAEALAEELRERPEVRKVLLNCPFTDVVDFPDNSTSCFAQAFDDYKETEYINVIEGRYPENDNEMMITKICQLLIGKNVGDTIMVKRGSDQQSFMISGIVSSLTNGGENAYFTNAGLKRLTPTYRPHALEIYLRDGADKEEFRKYLTDTYGRSLSDMKDETDTSGSYEERVRAAADKRIAELMAAYGVTEVEYAITSGDTVITGNNSGFQVKSFLSISDILDTQLAESSKATAASTIIFTIISAVVVMIIIFILMSATIKKQRRQLGIMKGMGYTSHELMLQLAFRIIPATIAAVIFGTLIALLLTNSINLMIGELVVEMPFIIIADIIILLFCFGCAYFGARKIKKISVYELMSE